MNEQLQLRDIHLPGDVSWWPLAPGWWLLLMILLFIALLLYKKWRQPRKGMSAHAIKQALLLVDKLEAQDDDRAFLCGISSLLRRAAISRYGRAQISGLAGEAWLDFLDANGGAADFSSGKGRVLLDLPYKKHGEFDRMALANLTRHWLKNQGRNHHA